MNNFYKFAATAVTAFFVGEAVGVARGNRHWMPQNQKVVRQNEVLVDVVEGLTDFIEECPTDPEGAMQRLNERQQFTQILLDNI